MNTSDTDNADNVVEEVELQQVPIAPEERYTCYRAAKYYVNPHLEELGRKPIQPQMLYSYTAKGMIPTIEDNGRAYILNIDLEEWLAKYLTRKMQRETNNDATDDATDADADADDATDATDTE